MVGNNHPFGAVAFSQGIAQELHCPLMFFIELGGVEYSSIVFDTLEISYATPYPEIVFRTDMCPECSE